MVLAGSVGCGGGPPLDPGDSGPPPDAGPVGPPIALDLGISYPPVSDERQRGFSAEHITDLHARIIRFEDQWALRQADASAPFVWSGLDAKLDWVVAEDLSLMLTIGVSVPMWACDPAKVSPRTCVPSDLDQFRAYVTALLDHMIERYGRVPADRIQFGNEWLSDFWYPGTGDDFVLQANVVYDAVHAASPATTVVLGSLATSQIAVVAYCEGRVDRYWSSGDGTPPGVWHEAADREAVCGTEAAVAARTKVTTVFEQARYDAVDQHLYDDVEQWPAYLATLREVLIPAGRLPMDVIVSEFGGPNTWLEPDDEAYQAERLPLYVETLDAEGVTEALFFSLVERPDDSTGGPTFHNRSGLMRDEDLTAKPAYWVFRALGERQD